jgi:hypothetical protein
MKDPIMIESGRLTVSGLTYFSDMCAEILKNIAVFERDAENFRMYFRKN